MAMSSKPGLEAGDRVRIKSGGPTMTAARVDHRTQQPHAHCAWVDQRGTFRFVSNDIAALELIPSS
jgi:uncharacterized protein YodC (DUF2158 family)